MNLINLFKWLLIRPIVMGIDPGLGFAIGGGLSLAGGLLGSRSSRRAAAQQAAAMREATAEERRQFDITRQDMAPWMRVATGDPIYDDEGKITGYTGGALQEYAGYGPSRVAEGDYIPASEIPKYDQYISGLPEIRSDIPQFNVGGEVSRFADRGAVPEFTGAELDVYQDPGYKFSLGEMQRQVDRGAAGMGKVMSGNRLEELMSRGGEMASQEYQGMWGRALQDYERQRARESEQYGRERDIYGLGRDVEQEQYRRGLTAFDAASKQEAQRYGRDVDQYGRELGLGEARYRARAGEEADIYGRGVSAYGRAAGRETDYLNRLAVMSKMGQQTATDVGRFGQQTASNVGANIRSAGAAQAAGTLGTGAAWQQALGDITALGTRYLSNQQPRLGTPSMNYSGAPMDYTDWMAMR